MVDLCVVATVGVVMAVGVVTAVKAITAAFLGRDYVQLCITDVCRHQVLDADIKGMKGHRV